MELHTFREDLLTHKHPEKVLALADKYLAQLEALKDDFILPSEHRSILPVLEYYAGDLEGWSKFVMSVRDRFLRKTVQYSNVQQLYRTILVRMIQQQRRERLNLAVEQAVKRGVIPDVYDDKIRYSRRCTQAWKLQRDAVLDAARSSTKSGRVSAEEREVLLSEFWANVHDDIMKGNLPKP